jgi:hypothetical protein
VAVTRLSKEFPMSVVRYYYLAYNIRGDAGTHVGRLST